MSFPTTQWTLVAQASLNGDTQARQALDLLCRHYHQPVKVFLRSRGYAEQEVEDFAQEFFNELLVSRAWQKADRGKGRFRSFILAILMHVVNRQKARAQAFKRGGGQLALSLDEIIETAGEPASPTPETVVFDREWAMELMRATLASVADHYLKRSPDGHWETLRKFLPGAGKPPSYEEAAATMGVELDALKSSIFRLRGQFRDELRRKVAATVGSPHEVDTELAYLHAVLIAKR